MTGKDKTLSELFAEYGENVVNLPSKMPLSINQQISDNLYDGFPKWSISSRPKPVDVTENLEYLLDIYKIKVRFNLMKREREIVIEGVNFNIEDRQNEASLAIYNLATINGLPTKYIENHLMSIALKNAYHPVVDWVLATPWDGLPRIDNFIKTLHTKDDKLFYPIIRRWLLMTIACAFSETGFAQSGILVLQGNQGIGKTRWVMSLCRLNGTVKDGAFIDTSNKDTIILLTKFWISEIGELDGSLRKSDSARLKSFITSPVDQIRIQYAKHITFFARRSSYCATVNDENYLVDETGNRRFWTIPLISVNYDHKMDMQQVWAELYQLYLDGEQTWPTASEQDQINSTNLSHEKIDPLYEKILSYFDWESVSRKELTATKILEEIGWKNISQREATRAASIIKKINGFGSRRSHGINLHSVPLYFKPRSH